ncbi:unnamed protein product [Tilletia controversa]|uniref:BTB domain-containing protein n=1 Tax=Tilletia controversa TaxID=13291 RepID=A0A8X7SWK5_9BASI|nr:hypothetical protein CF328_g4082 [Tilletia controversa]KAE8247325.1 hypothetical protein A4X06_0g4539 [Tilletia controversa]CAD6949928.1 unnamed protein product [Tilletia controversa]
MAVAGAGSQNGAPASSARSPRITITPSTARAPAPDAAPGSPSPTFSAASRQLEAMSPYSLEACLAEALDVWRKDLRSLFDHATDRFPDVGWTVPAEGAEGGATTLVGSSSHGIGASSSAANSAVSLGNPREETIWAHKAILYARAPNTFQARYLNLRSASEKLGHLANHSSVSLPSIRTSNDFLGSRPAWARRRTVRGSAPPSSFGLPKGYIAGSASAASDSEDDAGVAEPSNGLRRYDSRESLASSIDFAGSSDDHGSGYETSSVSDASMASADSASTIRPPLNLEGISTEFFSSILEYLYTAEESMVEAFEFLYQDRISLGGSQEERIEKLRQDFVFMWRSKLFSDVTITLSFDSARAIRSIPDATASALSLASSLTHADGADSVAGDDETSTFSTHRMILVSRSPYFAQQLLSKFADSHASTIHLPSPPFTSASVHFTLGFLYTGTLFFSNRTFDLTTAFQLWRSGHYLQVETLKSVISALIAKQFCHEFACSPPCKSCIKRVPRTLAFTCSPDVNEPHLGGRARAAVAGEHFGVYWGKEVGNLDYTARGAIVADTCARVENNPALMIPTLRQLSIIGTKIDTERTSKWVDALRWMCESVEGRLRDLLEAQFEVVVASAEWIQLLDGVTFMRDVLDKALVMLIDGLNERRAAKIYQVLVGTVLLREEGFAVDTIRQAIEDGRGGVLRFIKRRWIGIRAFAGFNGLERWCLKEISHEIDVPEDELLLSAQEVAALAPAKKAPKVAVLRAGARPGASRTASTEDREAGPINMRAQVLNRNAARATVTAASQRPTPAGSKVTRTNTGAPGASAPAANGAGSSMSPRIRTTSTASSSASVRKAAPPARAMSSASQVSTTSAASRASSTQSVSRSTTAAAAAAARTLSATDAQRTPSRTPQPNQSIRRMASASSIRSQSSVASAASTISGEAHTPTPSIRSVRTPQPGAAPPAAKTPTKSSSVGRVSGSSAAVGIKATSSAASLRAAAASPATSLRAMSSASSTAPTTPTTPSRRSNNTSATTPKAAATAGAARATATTPTKTHAFLKATPKPPGGKLSIGSASSSSLRSRTASTTSSNVATPVKRTATGSALSKTSNAVTSKSALGPKPVLGASTSVAANAAPVTQPAPTPVPSPPMEVDEPLYEMITEEDVKVAGTNLILGIPCIISPRNTQTGKSARLRATVKYIGPLKGRRGSWLGVEVPFPLPSGVEEDSLGGLNDGSDDGIRYFVLGLPDTTENDGDRSMSDVENDEVELGRRARRRRIAGVVRAASEALSSGGSDYQADSSNGSSVDNLSPESAAGPPSAKRLKGLRGTGLAMKRQGSSDREAAAETRGLFIRPHDVLFVVTPDGL